jgi:hypothetical protein
VNHPELVLAVAMGEVKLPLRLCDRNDLLPELLLLWKLWWSCVSIEERGRPILRPFDFEDEEGRFDCPKRDIVGVGGPRLDRGSVLKTAGGM